MAHEVNPISGEQRSKAVETSGTLPDQEQSGVQTGAVEVLLAPLAELLGTLVKVWRENRTLLIPLGLIFVLLPLSTLLIGLVVSLLAAIHSVPLLAPILKLIGVSYTVWFISGYLLSETTRQQLSSLWQKLLATAQSY